MTDPEGERPLTDNLRPRSTPPVQPWSNAGRGMIGHEGRRRSTRRRELSRFNDGLASMLAREADEQRTIDQVLTMVLRLVWAPVMLAGGILIDRVTGTREYSARELAAYLATAIIVGVSIDPLWRKFKGIDPPGSASQPDPFGPEAVERGFTRLGLAREAKDEPGANDGNS